MNCSFWVIIFCTVFILVILVYRASRHCTIDIVISRYQEELAWLKLFLKWYRIDRVFVYNKGPSPITGLPKNAKVIPLTNVGRCDHTYLYHIIQQYHDLADVTIFLPAVFVTPFGSVLLRRQSQKREVHVICRISGTIQNKPFAMRV